MFALRFATELSVGDLIADNDPRVLITRVLRITGFSDGHVFATDNYRAFKIKRTRIYMDMKPRRSGFSLVARA